MRVRKGPIASVWKNRREKGNNYSCTDLENNIFEV